MAEHNSSPWTMTCHPAEVAACTTSTRFSMIRGDWADPALADLVAPPVTITAFTTRTTEAVTILRQPGRHRAPAGPFEPPARDDAEVPTWRDLDRALAKV